MGWGFVYKYSTRRGAVAAFLVKGCYFLSNEDFFFLFEGFGAARSGKHQACPMLKREVCLSFSCMKIDSMHS